jgi:hypothetical protein
MTSITTTRRSQREATKRSAVILLLLTSARAHAEDRTVVRLEAGEQFRDRTPVTIEVPEPLRGAADLLLEMDGSTAAIPCQRIMSDPDHAIFLLDRPLATGESREYVLRAAAENEDATPTVVAEQSESAIRFVRRGLPVLQYNTATVEPPEGVDRRFRRSGHVHPVWTPLGRIITDEFPADHLHQHGIFAAWVNTTFEGRAVDFWNQGGGTGTVEHVAVESVSSGDVLADATVQLRHVDLSAPGGAQTVLNERWTIRCYDMGPESEDNSATDVHSPAVFLFDIESLQSCAGTSPLTLNEYHYGGMAWRGPAAWLGASTCDFLTSEGKTRADGNHSRPNWVCAHGVLDGSECSVAVFCHPENFRAPQPVRLHPDKPYFVFTPPALGAFEIAPGDELRARYRYAVHDGPPDAALYEQLWQDYADPPAVTILAAQ